MLQLRYVKDRSMTMSEASVDVVVEVIENFYPQQASGKDQFLWDVREK